MTEIEAELSATRSQRNAAQDEIARLCARLHATSQQLADAVAELNELKAKMPRAQEQMK